MSKSNVKSILKNQVIYILDELKKKDIEKMPIDELRKIINRLYEICPPTREHEIAIMTLHKRYEANRELLREKYKVDKLEKSIKDFQDEQATQIKGFMIQEINGFKIENKLK